MLTVITFLQLQKKEEVGSFRIKLHLKGKLLIKIEVLTANINLQMFKSPSGISFINFYKSLQGTVQNYFSELVRY